MRRRRMDHEYRDRRDEVKIEQDIQKRGERKRQLDRQAQLSQGRPQSSANIEKRIRTKKRKALQKKRQRNNILLVLGLILILCATYGLSKAYVAWKAWEGKTENSDFKNFTVTADEPKAVEMEEEIVNVAIFGTDEEGIHTDVNIVASFNTRTEELHFISVPRDTRVTMTSQMTSFLKQEGKYVPDKTGVYGQCKLTEVHAYAGSGNRATLSVAMLEEVLGIKMDYYVKIDLTAFKDIVNAVGGVDMEVQGRLFYEDPVQDLYINLYPGFQHLDGDKAEQLVRFREDYAQKDLKRIEVQQQFMQALLQKVCSTETILSNMNSLIGVVLDKTESDITLTEAMKYVKYLPTLDVDAITMDTIPGEGKAYFEMDEEGTKQLIRERIYGEKPAVDDDDSGTVGANQ